MKEKEILELKEKIEKAKITASEISGQIKAVKKQLKDDWKCNSLEEADEALKNMSIEIDSINAMIEKGAKELEEKLNKQ